MERKKSDLKEALAKSKFEMKEVAGKRLKEQAPQSIAANVNFEVNVKPLPEGIAVGMQIELTSEVAELKVVGNCDLHLTQGWEVRKDVANAFLADDCVAVMYPPLRQALSLLNYQLGLPHLLLPPQLSEEITQGLVGSYEGNDVLRYEAAQTSI
ncbi:MAG: hypothetical protein Q4E01_04580 [Actinomycetaceae bacterium]|nr:hypothetical protein [Actinomycetaceae bacterium]